MPASSFASCVRALLRAQVFVALLAWPALAQNAAPQSSQPPAAHQATPAGKPGQPGTSSLHKPDAHPPAHQAQKAPPQKSLPPKAGPHKEAVKKPAPGTHAPVKPAAPSPAATAASPQPEPSPTAAEKPPEPPKGSATGLPLPRYAALRSDEVNMRAGPGTRYPIDWVYKRRDLPVEIEREFEVWRLVSDPGGSKGWVHQATLTGRRSFVVTGNTPRMLVREPDDNAPPVAELKPGVIGHIRSCAMGSAWCQVQVGDYRGFLKRDEFWGTQPGEAVN
jgi:SH3-like domain-containing protein